MFMKVFYFLTAVTVLLIFPTLPQAQIKASGVEVAEVTNVAAYRGLVVEEATGKPIEGASVYISDEKLGAVTNENGMFVIKNLSTGNHLFEISHLGYANSTVLVMVDTNKSITFILKEKIIENNAVVVTGTSRAAQLKTLPFQVDVIKKEELQRQVSSNLIDALAQKPGVSAISSGPSISKPVIRGLGYNRVLVIQDGVRQEGHQWGDEHGLEIDESSVQRAEILKGPASLVYGSDAMAGVINLISVIPVPDRTMKINVESQWQSNNRMGKFHVNANGNKNGFIWNFYSTQNQASDYKNKYDGFVFNSKYKMKNLGGYFGLNKRWGYSHFLASSYQLTTGLIEGDRDDLGRFIKLTAGGNEVVADEIDFKSYVPQTPFQRIKHDKFSWDNAINFKKDRLYANLSWQRNQREEFGNPDDLTERELFFDLQSFNYTVRYNVHEIKGWKHAIGFNGMMQKNINRGVEQLIPNYVSTDGGLYIMSLKSYKKLHFSGGVRVDGKWVEAESLKDGVSDKSPGFNKHFSNVSGSVGVSFPFFKNANVKLNVARAFRSPNIPELASNGAHEGTSRYEYGNLSLKSETSTQFDASFEWNTDHISFNLAGYVNHFNGFIYYQKLNAVSGGDSLVDDDGELLTAFTFNQNKARLTGFEASIDFHPHPFDWLHVENTVSMVSGRFLATNLASKNIPFMPAPRVKSELRADLNKLTKWLKQTYVRLEMDWTMAQTKVFSAFNTETETPAYLLFNAGVGTQIINRKNKTICSVLLVANNLTDVAYQNHLSRLKYTMINPVTQRMGVYNMGRNFSIKLMIPISVQL